MKFKSFAFNFLYLFLSTSILYCSEPPKKDKEYKRRIITKKLDKHKSLAEGIFYKNSVWPKDPARLICKKDKYNDLLERVLNQKGNMEPEYLVRALLHGADANAQTLLKHAFMRENGIKKLFPDDWFDNAMTQWFDQVRTTMWHPYISSQTLLLLIKVGVPLNVVATKGGSPLRDASAILCVPHSLTQIADELKRLHQAPVPCPKAIDIDKMINNSECTYYHRLKQKIALLAVAGGKYIAPAKKSDFDESILLSTPDCWIPEPVQVPHADEINFVINALLGASNIKSIQEWREKKEQVYFSLLPKDLIHPLEQFMMEAEYPSLQ